MAGSWKVREAKLTYAQRIRDTYLENARKVAGDVYVPLAVAVSALSRAYGEFRNRVDFDNSSAPQGSVNRFKGSSNQFLTLVEGLLSRGASAYLTLPLEEALTDFVLFLEASLPADKVVRKISLSPSFYGLSTSVVLSGGGPSFSRMVDVARAVGAVTALTSPFLRIRLNVREEIIESPLPSREFEKRFQESTLTISSLIKEVTLGSRNQLSE